MIYITGDTHGDFRRFSMDIFPEQKNMTRDDFVIICGDFGGVFSDSREQHYWLDWLEEKSFTVVFCDGNHENYDLLSGYPEEGRFGGRVHVIRENVFHLERGYVFDIGGKSIFVMGGASSHDISDGILDRDDPDFAFKKSMLDRHQKYMYRIKGLSWWEQENISDDDMKRGLESLEKVKYKVDYVVCHSAPVNVVDRLYPYENCDDANSRRLSMIQEKSDFRYWFFGHYHENIHFCIDNRNYIGLYEQIFDIS